MTAVAKTNSNDRALLRDLVAFWIFGLANNFAYVVMLSAAKDILERGDGFAPSNSTSATCVVRLLLWAELISHAL